MRVDEIRLMLISVQPVRQPVYRYFEVSNEAELHVCPFRVTPAQTALSELVGFGPKKHGGPGRLPVFSIGKPFPQSCEPRRMTAMLCSFQKRLF